MKNRGVTSQRPRLPGLGHKAETRPTALPEQIAADRPQPDAAVAHAAAQTSEEQQSHITGTSRKASPPQAAHSGSRKYSLSLRIDRHLADGFARLLLGQSPSAQAAIRRRLAATLRARLDAGADFLPPATAQESTTIRLDLRLPPDFVARMRRRHDPRDLLPATTVIAQVIAPEYAALLDALLRRTSEPPGE
ncbi:hypothetical protein [Paracoccus sp. FO-3]|uniref:hypothetical protein n=1 Tax=Paracoccus sp. FO-3 TaxID=1335059 RepID=UPI0011275FD9|nr:hypothetical protein [Paracoccus sp. FO-3]